MGEEVLFVEKKADKFKIKIAQKKKNSWSPPRYLKMISNKDFNQLAYLFYDLNTMGFPIEKSFIKFKQLLNDEPELFFLK